MLHEAITDKIIKAFYKVNNQLGFGFLEKVYENAMAIELRNMGCQVCKQKNIKVYYEQEEVGDYYADLLIEVGLLINFGKKAEFKRKIFTNDKKSKTIAHGWHG
jgi:hypothetical protein